MSREGRMASALRACAACLLALSVFESGLGHAQPTDMRSETLPSPLRIEQVIQYARQRRAEIVAARARMRGAAQRPAIVSALEDPVVSPSLDHLPLRLDGANVSLTVEQRFPLSSVLGDRKRAADADVQRARAQVSQVTLDVELQAAEAFLMLQERRQLARILEQQHALAEQLVQSAAARYAAGAGTQADVLRAEIEVARLGGALRAIAAEVRAAEIMLNTSLGRTSQAFVPELESTSQESAPAAVDTVRKQALSQRPELQRGQAEVNRARADVDVMRSMYSPMAMVRTGPAYTMMDGPGWMLMLGVSVPLWRSKLRAGVDEAEAMVEMAQADLAAMRRMIEGEALSSREQTVAARERFLALRDDVVPRAQQAIEPALAAYASGQLPLVSVIEAAQALWSSQAELLSAQFALGLAWARLRRASGNGVQKP